MNDEYVKGEPYFCDVSEKICSFPYLEHDISCDNLIVGGGIDGAITAYYFAESGLDTALIDKNRLGHMCTSCATALLEYQLDEHAAALKKYFFLPLRCFKCTDSGLTRWIWWSRSSKSLATPVISVVGIP